LATGQQFKGFQVWLPRKGGNLDMAQSLLPVGVAAGRRCRQLLEALLNQGAGLICEEDLNAALLQAASEGHQRIVHVLIDAGATNLVDAMTCAGWSGHVNIVDTLILRTHGAAVDAAFVGALVGLRKEMVEHIVHVADVKGLEKCLLMGVARIWSCKTVQEAEFLLNAIEILVGAGARNFQTAMQVSCGDATIEYWNRHVFDSKAKILERIVVLGSRHLTPDFVGRILLMICVTFLCKLMRFQERNVKSLQEAVHMQATQLPVNSIQMVKAGYMDVTREDMETTIEDMLKLLSIVCRSGGVELVSTQLLALADFKFEDVRSLLHISRCFHDHHGDNHLSHDCAKCRLEWPLKMMKFLLVDCGIKELSATVTVLPIFQAARLNVLLPVVQCFLEQNCFDASFIYLDMAIVFCQGEAIEYLLHAIPKPMDIISMVETVRCAASNIRGKPRGPEGLLFALHSNFLNDPIATLAEAAILAELQDTDHSVKSQLRKQWSQQAFEVGTEVGHRHFLNWMLVRKRSCSSFRLGELPHELQVAVGYLSLYRDCSRTPGSLLSQRQQGELVSAICHLYQGSNQVTEAELLTANKVLLLRLLAACLPDWCQQVTGSDDASTLSAFFRTHKTPSN
jgi:hypothetical protein